MSTARLFTLLLLIALFTMTVREISDPDFWWHLRTGQYIVEKVTLPHTDPFSFTAQGKEWITHEWLSEVLFFGMYRVGGFAVLTLIFSGVITLAFGLTYARSAGKPYLAGFALLLGALATAPTWGVRPQMLSLLLMSVFLFLLDRYALIQDPRVLFALPLLMLLWVNLHSGYALGLVVIGAYWFSALIEGIAFLWKQRTVSDTTPEIPPPSLTPRMTRNLLIVLLLSVIAVLFNPNGARMFTYPFETLTSPAMQRYIQEWFSPDFHQTEWLPFALLIFGILATTLIARARVPLAHILLLFVFGLAGLRSVRNIPLLALVAIPVLSAQLAAWIPLRASARPTPRPMQILNAAIVALLVVVALLHVGGVLMNQANVERQKFPAAAVEWIQKNRPAPNIYNSYGWGGYLIWKLYPDYLVYIDGRADVHGDVFIEKFLDIYRASPGWENELAQKNVNLILVEPDAPLATALATNSQWTKVFADSQSVIYQKK
jgi:hypothetical protein